MTVTKQQQLEWLAKEFDVWPGFGGVPIRMSSVATGEVNNGLGVAHHIRTEEWKQERDKMQKESAQLAQDNSWHERGELPPVGCECEVFVSDENKWMHYEVIAIRDGHVLGWCRESSCGFQSNEKSEFRPLRTEREKAIEEISTLVRDGLVSHEMAKEFAVKMHDAGLKLVKR